MKLKLQKHSYHFSYSIEETSMESLRINCTNNLNCGSCIKNPLCAWCADPKWEDNGQYFTNNPGFTDSNTDTKAMRRRPRCDLKIR